MRALAAFFMLPVRALEAQHGALFAWVPVCMALGIGTYFALPAEPGAVAWGVVAGSWCAGAGLILVGGWRNPLFMAVFLVLTGVALCGVRTMTVEAPVLAWRYYGAVEGRVLSIDRSASEMPRLTLDQVVLDDVPPDNTPHRVRVSLHGDQHWLDPAPGQKVVVTAHLGPPEGPVEPGGFNFQRMAWFDGLGAVGYARTPTLLLEPAEGGLLVARIRMAISEHVQRSISGEVGAFAAAITTGDRSGMSADTVLALRVSNLAHLLAISGLHMGLLTGVVFSALRFGLALVPAIALSWPIKKWAACGALLAGAGYLALSGGTVATQRAYIMVAVMFGAVLLDRRALTLRAVALAAVIVLVLRPEALTEPGFQMSFAATTALVGVFGAMRRGAPEWIPRWTRPFFGVIISSAVAGAATAPVAAAHFNQVAQYGLLANLLSVPLMGAVVMPAAVLAACLYPLGLSWVGFTIMAPAIAWILGVADWVSSFDGALWRVPSPGPWVIPLFVLGSLWLIIWRGNLKALGISPVIVSFALWAMMDRPGLLVSPGGGLIGLMTPDGRVLNKSKGEGFAARSWLENDGDTPDQEMAAVRMGFETGNGKTLFDFAGFRGVHLSGRGAAERASALCASYDLVILAAEVDADGGCLLLDGGLLQRTGAVAFQRREKGVRLETVTGSGGHRAWNRSARSRGSHSMPARAAELLAVDRNGTIITTERMDMARGDASARHSAAIGGAEAPEL